MDCIRIGSALALGLLTTLAAARPMTSEEVPDDLRPWIKWVLAGNENLACPFLYNSLEQRRCAWPTELKLDFEDAGGEFDVDWRVYTDSWVTLPGDTEHWPQEVAIDGHAATVTERDGRPVLHLDSGIHGVHGRFLWQQLPEAINVPADSGIVRLAVRGNAVDYPDVNGDGRLWLRARDTGGREAAETDRLELQVYRLIAEEIPMQVTTRLDLKVAGQQREVVLSGALLEGFMPLSLASPLPARMEPDGSLRLQVRPGRWNIDLTARHPRALTALKLTPAPEPWPANEVWAYSARNHLRLVEIEGVTQIDPRQTTLPAEWQSFPAYRMSAGEQMSFKVVRRGDPQPEPDRLTLHRSLWLDFDGRGYTFNDTVGGTMTSGWRLDAGEALQPGRVAIDGQPQLITRAPGNARMGIEMRRGTVNLNADGRLDGNVREVPAVGWDHDFQQVGTTLNLPPGWRLFGVSGVDNKNATGAWLYKWTLLDLFLVLIAAVAVARMWDAASALAVLIALALIWHEPGAPRQVWLHLLAAIALLQVLPPGRFRALVSLYRTVTLIALAVIAVPFMVQQVRVGLFPQLEYPWAGVGAVSVDSFTGTGAEATKRHAEITAQAPAPAAAPPMTAEEAPQAESFNGPPGKAGMIERKAEQVEGRLRQMYDTGGYASSAVSAGKSVNLNEIDPKANVQTGPGLPRWTWTQVPLSWNGPVERDQRVQLVLLSPRANLALSLIRVVLLALIAAALAHSSFAPAGRRAGLFALTVMTCIGVGAGLLPRPALAADFPGTELLNELKTRLLAPPECLPACAESPRLQLRVAPDQLQMRMEVHATENVAVPLPARAGHWLPTEVLLDGARAVGLSRTPDGQLLVNVPIGPHQISLSGPLPARATVQVPLPLTPRRVEIEQAGGWRIDGVHEDGTTEAQLLLTRQRSASPAANATALEPVTLPPFARIERTLRLGLNWRVETQVIRVSPADSAIVLEVPLLPGESVTTDGVRVVDGKVQVNMSAHESSLYFESVLEKTTTLKLTAPETTAWTEVWRADVSPVLHVVPAGIAVIHHQGSDGNWLPEWRPWPGETVTLTVMRPQGVEGRIYTVDASTLRVTPGERTTDTGLDLVLRSSQGGQHTLTLPAGAALQSATINGVAQPIRQQQRLVTLPLTPGTQNVTLTWREPDGMRNRLTTPSVDLGTPSVNASVHLLLPGDRWVLLTGGPRLGPAVLFWGVLLVIAIIAAGLGRIRLTPLSARQWLLLGVGLSQVTIMQAAVVVGWLLALGLRGRIAPSMNTFRFNCIQIALFVLTLVALGFLFDAIRQGLLGMPDMQIAGNNPDAYNLNWYQDHTGATLPRAWVLSVPLLAYHLLMLAWALWLAFALLSWLRWGWNCYALHGLWRPFSLFRRRPADPRPAAPQTSS